MKPALQLRIQPQLALTPQLQHAIRLLQLSSMELETELNLVLESNPLLDLAEPDADDEQETDAEQTPQAIVTPASACTESAPEVEDHTPDFDDTPLDLGHGSSDYRAAGNDDSDSVQAQDSRADDLHDHLLWQLNLTPFSPRDRAIATVIIEAISDDGYLLESNESICASLVEFFQVECDEVEAVRHRIRHFDPLGVGSRTLRECLELQLSAMVADTPGLDCARGLVNAHLESLARNDRTRLRQQLRVDADELDQAIALVRSLSPRPGAGYSSGAVEFIAPDAFAFKVNGRWEVSLSPYCQPRLNINEHYVGLIGQASREDASYLRGQLQEARWMIKSLQMRAETILKVAQAIVRAQSAFLDFGTEAMRPLVLREIAEEIEMHESTVSRVTTRKYLHTPRGTFEFKYFFSSGVATVDGGSASATAIQAMIRKLIEEESSARPLSDQTLTVELNQRGITVARRTVAKYREALGIASSNERCRLD